MILEEFGYCCDGGIGSKVNIVDRKKKNDSWRELVLWANMIVSFQNGLADQRIAGAKSLSLYCTA